MRSYRAPRRKPRHGHGTEHPPRSHEHWLGDFIADDDADEALPEPVTDALVAWVDAETLEPVALDVVPREDAERALADLLITAMQQPEWGRPRRPASVAVSRPAAERLVRDRVRGLGIQVRLDEELEAWKLAMAHVLGVFATHAPDRSYLDGDGVTPELVGRLFHAAAVCYRETPWAALAGWTPFELELPGHPAPAFVAATDDADGRPAVRLFLPDPVALDPADDDGGDAPPAGSGLHVRFEPEDEVPDALAEARRAHGWPLAAPDACPLLHLGVMGREPREASAAELECLALALAAIPAFLARHRDVVEAHDDVSDTVDVGDVVVGSIPVRVTFPALSDVAADWQLLLAGRASEREDDGTEQDDDGAVTLDALRRRISALPHARSVVDRLAWSFFRDTGPSYIDPDDDEEIEDALMRFLDWAAFLARVRPGRRTLAEEAVERAAAEVSPDELEVLDRLAHPRYSVFEITGVAPGRSLTLRDLNDGETLHVLERTGSRSARRGWLVVGSLHPVPGDAYIVGSVFTLRSGVLREGLDFGGVDPTDAALWVEEFAYGAGTDWIGDIETRRELKRAYDRFRTALGEPIPSYPELERLIHDAATPEAVFDDALRGVHWWTDVESEVFLTLFDRAWDLTR